MMPTTKASSGAVCAGCQSSSGSFMPRFDRKAMDPRCSACFGAGQSLQQRVPEEQLQQQRQVAQCLDIECRDLRQQPVLRQPADADQGAEDGGQDDADNGDLQGVQHADQQRPAIGVDRRCRGSATRRWGCPRRGRGTRNRSRYAAPPGWRWCCPPDTRRSRTTIPTITTCQTIARNTGSVHDSLHAPLRRPARRHQPGIGGSLRHQAANSPLVTVGQARSGPSALRLSQACMDKIVRRLAAQINRPPRPGAFLIPP